MTAIDRTTRCTAKARREDRCVMAPGPRPRPLPATAHTARAGCAGGCARTHRSGEFEMLGAMVVVHFPHDLHPLMRKAGGMWEPGGKRWLIHRGRMGPLMRDRMAAREIVNLEKLAEAQAAADAALEAAIRRTSDHG
jgi:hypothetical protein